jgi:hypothetical protein
VTGETYTLSITINAFLSDYISTWIDWNQDEDFLDAGESFTVATNTGSNGPHTVDVTIPIDAAIGNTVMRVTVKYQSAPSSDEVFGSGEVEDYTVAVTAADNTPFFSQQITGGDIAFDALGMRSNAAFSGGTLTPSLSITGISATDTIVSAWLYVSELDFGAIDTTFTLNATSVSAVPVDSSSDPNWASNQVVSVRADVKSIVTGNGTYTLGGASDLGADDYEGAVLVVVYSDTASAISHIVTVSDKSTTVTNTTALIPLTFNDGDTLPVIPLSGSLLLASFDAQDSKNENALFFEATTADSATSIIAANSWGSDLGEAETFTIDIASLVARADTGASLTQVSEVGLDYLVYPFWATVIQATTPVLSVQVRDSTFTFGTSPLNAWLSPQSSVVINDGDMNEDFVAQVAQFSDGSNAWDISASANGADSIRAQWSITSDTGPWSNITAYASDFTIATNVAVDDSITLWFRVLTPKSTASFDEHSSPITVTAQQY